MSKPLFFCFGLHNHQPVGNFDFVFEEAYRKAYLPFLDVFEPHEGVKVTQHYTGILLDWFADHHPDFLDRLGKLVDRGRIELLSGGYYEPILPMLPQRDRVGQIEALNEKIRSLFGVHPRGAWVAERVWEPFLVSLFADCGMQYVLLDDAHFKMAGIPEHRLLGPFVTEDEGKTLSVFPISQRLRYLIPFHPVEETMAYLRDYPIPENQTACVSVTDDGEKFGVWPGTHHSVYGEGWLEHFFTVLEEAGDFLKVVTYSEALADLSSRGLVYLPTASYSEMMDWALPAEETQAIEDFRASLDPVLLERYGRFIKGGFWRSFLSKYREVQHLHRKMLTVSEKVAQIPDTSPTKEKALHHLWAAQCNCGYWHGVFGGIYLNHIRAENYRNLILAENLVEEALHSDTEAYRFERGDFFRDGGCCLAVRTPTCQLLFDLDAGGTLVEWDDLVSGYNLINTLTRRPEAYHREITGTTSAGPDAAVSIHELHVAKEEGLEALLIYDPYRRAANIPHFFDDDLDLDTFIRSPSLENNQFPGSRFQGSAGPTPGGCEITLEGVGSFFPENPESLRIRQKWIYSESDATWVVSTTVRNLGDTLRRGWFGLEFGWSFNTGNAPDRYYRFNKTKPPQALLGSVGSEGEVRELELVEGWWGVRVHFRFEKPARVWRFPIETVSSSESGFERVYQSSVVIPAWNVQLQPGAESTITFVLGVRGVTSE